MKNNFQNDAMNAQEPMNAQDEPMLLMSLALDGMLSPEEEANLHGLLAQDESLAVLWDEWQRMDSRFSNVGRVLPPVDFVQQFEVRLAAHDSRQLWWSNLFVIIGALVIWGGLLVGALFVGYSAYTNQAELMSDFVHSLIGFSASLMQWLRAFRIAMSTASSSPQTVGLAVGYVCAAAAALMWWIHFLRNSTQVIEQQHVQG